MEVLKAFDTDSEVMEKINRFTRRTLSKEEVYAFPVILCDNEIDRDGERFSVSALKDLAKLFIGKTGIFDHNPKGENQTSRIFDTEVKTFPEKITQAGEPYTCIEARAYILRSDKNRDLIDEIDGGIKKEVSVSCSVKEEICSICKQDRRKKMCPHIKGKTYGGKVCHIILNNPTDAYEFSFVAVPAQKNAGVIKCHKENSLKNEVAKLLHSYDTVLSGEAIEKIVNSLSESEQKALKTELSDKLSRRITSQLIDSLNTISQNDNSSYSLK